MPATEDMMHPFPTVHTEQGFSSARALVARAGSPTLRSQRASLFTSQKTCRAPLCWDPLVGGWRLWSPQRGPSAVLCITPMSDLFYAHPERRTQKLSKHLAQGVQGQVGRYLQQSHPPSKRAPVSWQTPSCTGAAATLRPSQGCPQPHLLSGWDHRPTPKPRDICLSKTTPPRTTHEHTQSHSTVLIDG